jgi:hypothetical protein
MIRRTCGAFLVIKGGGYSAVGVNMMQPDSAEHSAVTPNARLERLKRIVILALDRLKPAGRIGPVLNIVIRDLGNFDHETSATPDAIT